MLDTHLAQKESKFADIIWENEPLNSSELVRIAAKELEWKKSTTYTVLKKLCEKGIFKNENATVSAVVSKEDFLFMQSERLIENNFGGSLPAFFAAFANRKELSEGEIKALYDMLEAYKK